MPKFLRGVLRLVVVAAVVAVLWPSASDLMSAGLGGRDFQRCVASCNEAKSACNIRCSDDCFAMFPGGNQKDERNACIAACRAICLSQDDECKARCQAIHHGDVSPNEP